MGSIYFNQYFKNNNYLIYEIVISKHSGGIFSLQHWQGVLLATHVIRVYPGKLDWSFVFLHILHWSLMSNEENAVLDNQ